MPRLPALCGSCGAVYPSPLRAADPADDNAFEISLRCPACGESGRVPPEILKRLARAVEELRREAPSDERERLAAFLREMTERPPNEVPGRLDLFDAFHRDVPTWASLAGAFPSGPPPELAGFFRLLETARGVVETTEPGPGTPEILDRVLSSAYERHAPEACRREAGTGGGDADAAPEARARRRLDATGRNDPCPCGSGEKYKDCHWLEDLRLTRA